MRITSVHRRLTVSASAIALSAIATSTPASAAVCTWTGGNSLWTTIAQWSCGIQPGSIDDVVISVPGSIVNITGIAANAGTISLANGNQLNIRNSSLSVFNNAISNNGTITLGGAAGFAQLINSGTTLALTGTGTIVLDQSAAGATPRIYGGRYDFGSGQSLVGSGFLGINQTIVTNNGLFSANVNGKTLDIDVTGGSGGLGGGGVGTGNNAGLLNNNIIEASGGGILDFSGGLYENSATGVIRALNGSVVNLGADSRIMNGTLTSVGTGAIQAFGTTQYLTNVTLSAGSNLKVQNNSLNLNTTLTNNGTITVGGAAGFAQLINETANLAINGTGTIILDSAGASTARIYGGNITFGAGQTVQGNGFLGINQTLFTINNVFSANSGSNLDFDVTGGSGGLGGGGVGTGNNAGLLNNSTIQSTGGSTVNLGGGLYENSATGVIQALNGSVVNLGADSRIMNGTLTSVGTGAIQAFGTTQYLTNVTLSAGSNLKVQNNNLYLNTTLTNNGTITVGGAAGFAQLINEGGTLTLSGSGTIVLDNSVAGSTPRIYGGNIIFGSNQLLTGSGSLGINQTIFTNNNLFSANSGSNLSIDVTGGSGGVGVGNGVGTNTSSGLLNNGIMEATGGSTISFEGGLYENAIGGIIRATNNSFINLNADSRILNGTLTSDATSAIQAFGTTQYLTNVTLSAGSNLKVQNNNLYLNTTLTNNGTITVGGAAGFAQLINETANLAINGTGTIILDSAGASTARIYGGNITFGAGQTVQGNGSLGINQTLFTINNVFSANSGSNLDFDVTGGSGGLGGGGVGTGNNAGLLNNSTIQSTGGSTVNLGGGLYENSATGVIQALNGSVVNLGADSRIMNGTLTSVGTGAIQAFGTTQYLTNVTLSAGSNLKVQNNNLYLNTTLTNNGTITVGGAAGFAQLINETANLVINGTGTIILDSAGAATARIYAGNITFGAGHTVQGEGALGINQTIITNNGLISASAGTGISIDVTGGSGGVGVGTGVGTNTSSGLLNNGTIQAANGSSMALEGGRYENSATGTFGATGAGSTFVMNGDASLFNLKAGGVLDLGTYISTTNGAASTLFLRSNAANSLSTIGTGVAGTNTVVTLSGVNSVLNVTNFGTGVNTSIDSSLTTVAQSGRLNVLGGRNMTIIAGGGAFSNAGIVQLGGGTFGATSYTNSGLTTGFGSITTPISNSGTVEAAGGTLATRTITGAAGILRSLSGATLDISGGAGNSTAGTLTNNGNLALGTRNVTVTTDYTNASFGSGNAFNNHANVSGTGQLLALNATMDLSGTGLSGNNLNVGNVRIGGTSATTLTITNNGTSTNLIGAVKNSAAPGISLTGADWTAAAGGGTANVGLSFNGVAAGSLAGQTLNVVNNFDNVASRNLNVIGAAYNAATASVTPNPVALGNARIGGTLSGTVTITNTAPAGLFSEGLAVTGATATGSASAGATPAGLIAAGGNQTTSVQLSTATAGAKTGSVTYGLATDGAGTSGLAQSAIASQGVTVNGSVFAVANPLINNAASFFNIGPVLVGSVVTRTLDISNVQLAGALGFQEGLNVGWGSVTGNSIAGTVGSITNLAAGGTNSSNLVLTFDTSSAGAKVGAVDILLTSNGLGTSGLGLFELTTQSLAVTGQVNSIVNVLNPAVATIVTSTPITIADQRVGGSGSAALTIRNDGIGPSAGLDGSFASATNTATGTGSFANIASGSTSNAISVGVNTSAAGARGGAVTLNFASNLSPNPNVALPSQIVNVSGNVYQAAVAGAQPGTIALGARRVGDAAATSVVNVSNSAPLALGFNEALTSNLNVGSGFLLNGAGTANVMNLGAGGSSAVSLSRATTISGSFADTISFANTSIAVAGSSLSNLALAGQSISVSSNVYASAIAGLSGNSVNFGTVRQGAASPVASLVVTNNALGALADSLVTGTSALPASVTASAPGPLGAGQSGAVNFSLNTATAGIVSGSGSIDFTSVNPEMSDLILTSQSANFSGMITQLANATLFKSSGLGTFSGSGNVYSLNFGSLASGSGSFNSDLGVLNTIPSSSFSELLNGSFSQSAGSGYSFFGNSFTGLAGGGQNIGNLLTFDTTGLTAGIYTKSITFNGFSSFNGLSDFNLTPITLNVSASVTGGGVSGVPEPTTWLMMLLGFGLIGATMRRSNVVTRSRFAA